VNLAQCVFSIFIFGLSPALADIGVGEKDPGFASKSVPVYEAGEAMALGGGKVIRLGFSFFESFNSVSAPTLYFIDNGKVQTPIIPRGYDCLHSQVEIMAAAFTEPEPKKILSNVVKDIAVIVEYTVATQKPVCNPYSVLLRDRLLVRPCFSDETFGKNPGVKECQLVSVEMFKRQFARYAETNAQAEATYKRLRAASQKVIEALTK